MKLDPKKDKLFDDNEFKNWKKRWEERLSKNNNNQNKSLELMRNNNPLVIPRNHKIEEALGAAEQNDLEPFNKIYKILEKPYFEQKEIIDYQLPSMSDEKFQTFCGT